MGLLEHLGEEGTVRVRIGAEHDDMATDDHVLTLGGAVTRSCRAWRAGFSGYPRLTQSVQPQFPFGVLGAKSASLPISARAWTLMAP
jgi:hypothetical protein